MQISTLKIEHKMHPNIEGSPDVVISNRKTAIFLHGCFWHKCPKHYKNPKSNTTYWIPKIENNAIRDKNNIKLLKIGGWNVIVVWEHEFKNNFDNVLRKLNGVVGIANQRNVDKSKRKII